MANNPMKYAIGIMSGTSLDGVDVALVKIGGVGIATKIELVDFITVDFTNEQRSKIMASFNLDTSDVRQICSLNFELGYIFAEAGAEIIAKNDLNYEDIEFIGSHGQTVYHQPEARDGIFASTLQIGEPSVIAYELATTVVSNFRVMDMAAGGQGAPLVPFSEWIVYQSNEKSRLLQNIGGISNVTIMPKSAKLEDVIAFDTGPGNMIIDEICSRLFGVNYDSGGYFASLGVVNNEMLTDCLNHQYFTTPPPKTTGRELFGQHFVDELLAKYEHHDKHDILATMTMFTAKSIVLHYEKYILPKYEIDEAIISGGGCYNKTLVRMISTLLEGKCRVLISEDIGYSSAAKEAIAFVILANEALHKNPSNVTGATGAKSPVILGNITYSPR